MVVVRLTEAWQRFWGLSWWMKGAIAGGWMLAAVLVVVAFVAIASNGTDQRSVRNGLTPEYTDEPPRATPTAVVLAAVVVPSPTPEPPPTPKPLPDRADCEEMRGTEYRSQAERAWFLNSCVTPVPVSPQRNAPEPEAPQQPPPLPVPDETSDAADRAVVNQMSACADAWWSGSTVEAELAVSRLLGIDTSYLEGQYDALNQYLQSSCVGIGGRLASVAGAGQLCFEMLQAGSVIATAIALADLNGAGTFFLSFAKRETDGFLSAAGC